MPFRHIRTGKIFEFTEERFAEIERQAQYERVPEAKKSVKKAAPRKKTEK